MKLNIRSHDTGAKTLTELVQKLDEAGIDGVQLVPYKIFEDFAYETGSITRKKAEKIKTVLGGKIPLIGAYFNPVHSDTKKCMRCEAIFCDYLTYCTSFGATCVGSETGSYNDDKWTFNPLNRTEEALDIVIKTFTRLCVKAAKFGVNVGIEGAAGHVCYDVQTLQKAVKAIGYENLKIIFDLYNFLDESNHTRYLEILDEGLTAFEKNICVFHIKDYVLQDGRLKQVAVGKGIIDFEKVFKRIKQYDQNAELVLEGTVGSDIEYSVKFIKDIWGKV